MQIVIEIQEDDFEKIKNTSFVEDPEIMLRQSLEDRKDTMMLFRVIDAIKDCTPLPKGHGRLIDADEYKEHLYACETNGRPLHIMNLDERLATVDETPTIIEADMAGSEVENAE